MSQHTIDKILRDRARITPGRIAIDEGGRTWTYAELDARSEQALDQYKRSSGNRDLPGEMTDLMRRQVIESMIRLQLLAYEIARRRGLNVDQPRNLAKTVTVE